MRQRIISTAGAALLFLSACQQPGQSQYGFADVGKTTVVEYGIVEGSRPVGITGKNTGTGSLVGGVAGAGAASYAGSGSGSLWAALGGAIAGALIGGIAEQAASDRTGIEYVVDLDMGKTITIVQEVHKQDRPLNEGERCMVQTSGQYQRVLPSNKPFPDEEKPKHHKDDDDEDDSQ